MSRFLLLPLAAVNTITVVAPALALVQDRALIMDLVPALARDRALARALDQMKAVTTITVPVRALTLALVQDPTLALALVRALVPSPGLGPTVDLVQDQDPTLSKTRVLVQAQDLGLVATPGLSPGLVLALAVLTPLSSLAVHLSARKSQQLVPSWLLSLSV